MNRILCAAFAAAGLLSMVSVVAAQDAAKGRELYNKVGCYTCHGYNGQGGNAGPKLAPDPMAADAIATFIRNAAPTRMPQYVEKVLSNEEIAHIHAWLASQPKQKNFKEIPMLSE